MNDQIALFRSPSKREPWNKGKFTGPNRHRAPSTSGPSGASCRQREGFATLR